jgi:hypothetical protein
MDPKARGSNSSGSSNSTSGTQKHRVSKRRYTKEDNDVTEPEAKVTNLWTLRPAAATAPVAATLHQVLIKIESESVVSQKNRMTSLKPKKQHNGA